MRALFGALPVTISFALTITVIAAISVLVSVVVQNSFFEASDGG